ncbi:MAG: MoxR family ATPase [Acidobacteria bacterium]|nr:MoxR family ATPase [Acidobacteriota bacterium]
MARAPRRGAGLGLGPPPLTGARAAPARGEGPREPPRRALASPRRPHRARARRGGSRHPGRPRQDDPDTRNAQEEPVTEQTAATPLTPAAAGPASHFTRAFETVAQLREEIGRAVVGQHVVVEETLTALLAGGHILVEGVPGLGKTLLVLALARAFGGSFARIQFTPDLMPTDVTGHAVFDAKTQDFRIRRGPAFAHLVLADEINRAPAKTQAALLEVMQENQISIEGQSFPVPQPYLVVATQNPIEMEGTYPLPEAQLDRFLLKIHIDYPAAAEEVALVKAVTGGRVGQALDVSAVNQVASPELVSWLQSVAAAVLVDDRITDYAVRIVRATRTFPGIRNGAGPRGAIALVRAARAMALLQGRDFVVPDDVRRVALPVLIHRVIVSPELEIEGQRASKIVPALLEKVEAPRL